MEEIIARWEWRTFGADFGQAESNIRDHPAGKVRESSEVYILSRKGGNNTKIRDMLMDVKELRQINSDGLEQWFPVMKSGFPLDHAVLKSVCGAWSVDVPELVREGYSYEQFLGEVVGAHPELAAVDVFKERHGFTINGCIVEIANLKFDGSPIRTIAVEMADPACVMATVRELGLSAFENINYVKALKRHAGILS